MGALGWMPWTILFAERAWSEGRSRIFAAAVVAAMQMLSGAPEIILMTWCLLGTLWLFQATAREFPAVISLRRLVTVTALVAGISAVQLLPFFELIRQSDREGAGGTSAWSMPAWGLANFLVPLFR